MAVSNIVCEWLRALGLSQYAESFLDNGYDDLEICKQVGDPDLDAIGVINPAHRHKLLKSIRQLREKGAASVYFMLNDPNSLTGSTEILCETPPSELDVILRQQLEADGIRLTAHPYSTPDGQRGHLEGLASVYCELLMAPFGDVLSTLENARQASWAERSPLNPAGMGTTRGHRGSSCQGGLPNSHSQPIYVPGKYSPSSCLSDKEEDEIYGFGYGVFAPRVARGALTAQQQQHLFQQQQQQLQTQSQQLPNTTNLNLVQQSCLSPRSAYFYEFPPTVEGRETKKRTTLARLLKGLKTVNRRDRNSQQTVTQIRTANERLRHFQMNGGPQQSFEETIQRLKIQEAMRKKEKFQREHEEILRDIRQGLLQMSREGKIDDTYMYDDVVRGAYGFGGIHYQGHWYDEPPYESDPDDFLMSGINSGPAATIQGGRVRFTSNSRESTGVISLRSAGDISLPQRGPTRRGLIVPQQPPNPPTIIPLTHARSHDRESGDYAGSISDLQSVTSRLSTVSIGTNNCTARYRTLSGGIGESPSLSPSPSSDYEDDIATTHGLQGLSKNKKNGVHKGTTISQKATVHHYKYDDSTLSVNSKVNLWLEKASTSSEAKEISNSCLCLDVKSLLANNIAGEAIIKYYKDHSTLTDKHRDEVIRIILETVNVKQLCLKPVNFENIVDQISEVFPNENQSKPNELRNSPKEIGAFNENGRNFTATKDTSRDFSISQDNTDRGSMSDQAFACSASSVESLPSASGSSTQALVRPGSPHSSISTEDRNSLTLICKAKALVDSLPNPYDKEALRFKKGDIIDVLSMNASGIWKGRCHGRIGHFKFINVEVMPEQRVKNHNKNMNRLTNSNGPKSVEDLLFRIGLKEYTSVFILNGYEDLELFKELEPADLDYLGIVNGEHRAKLLTAVQLLHDIECSDGDIAGSSSENDETRLNNINKVHGTSPFGRRHFPRDSGCYEGSPIPSSQTPTQTINSTDESNSLDEVVAKCSNEILKRVESARRQKEDKCPLKGVSRVGKKGLLGGSISSSSTSAGITAGSITSGGSSSGLVSSSGDETLTRGGALSEKSSDSGVSSSSLSSGPIKNSS